MIASSNAAVLRDATEADLAPWFRLARDLGMYADLDATAADRFGRYSVVDNPWRQGRRLGIVVERDGCLIGGVLNFHLPVRLGEWTGTGIAPSAICLTERGPLGLALINRYLDQGGHDLLFVHHVNSLGTSILRRRQAMPCAGSDQLFSGILSPAVVAREALRKQGALGAMAARLLPRASLSFLGRQKGFSEIAFAHETAPEWVSVDPEGAEADALAELCSNAHPVGPIAGIDRTLQWLIWRYRRHPRADCFKLVGLRKGRSLAGFAAVEIRQAGMARICDFIAEPKSGLDLLRAAAGVAKESGAAGLEGRAGNAEFRRIVTAAGFKTWQVSNPQCWVVPSKSVTSVSQLEADYWSAEHWLH